MSMSRMVPAMSYGMVPRNSNRSVMEQFFEDDDDFFNYPMIFPKNWDSTPQLRLDIKESESNFEIVADLPGVPKENVDVSLRDNVLTISAERQTHKEEDKNGFLRKERSFGKVTRSFTLPENVNADRISCESVDGVLHVSLPKKDVLPRVKDSFKRIPISARSSST